MGPLTDLWKAEIPYIPVSTPYLLKKNISHLSIWLGGAMVHARGVLFLIFCFSLLQVPACLAFTLLTYEN